MYRVEIFEAKDGEYYVRVRHTNNRIVLVTEGYSTHWNARRAGKRLVKIIRNAELSEVAG